VVQGDLAADDAPESLDLIVNGEVVATTTAPGTLVYLIPSDGDYDLSWLTEPGRRATWTVSCESEG
jgi:hypothetical protein